MFFKLTALNAVPNTIYFMKEAKESGHVSQNNEDQKGKNASILDSIYNNESTADNAFDRYFGEFLPGFTNKEGGDEETLRPGEKPKAKLADPGYKEVPATEETLAAVIKIVANKNIIELLIRNSMPESADVSADSYSRVEVLQQWRTNIMNNYNALVKTTEKEFFDFETKRGAAERDEKLISSLKNMDVYQAKLDYKSEQITNRKTNSGEDQRNTKDRLQNERDAKIGEINKSYKGKAKSSKGLPLDVIGRTSKEQHVKDNRILQTYNWDAEDKLDAIDKKQQEIHDKRSKFGQFFSNISRKVGKLFPGKINTASLDKKIDPVKDFAFALGRNQYKFNFAPITLDQITPLITPRAKDSIVDSAPDKVDDKNIYSRIKGLDKLAGDKSDEEMDDAYKKEVSSLVVGGTLQKPADMKKTWEADQDKKARQDLKDKYKDLYDLQPELGDGHTGEYDKDNEYDKEGIATQATRDNFYKWLEIYTPKKVDGVEIEWDSKKKLFKSKIPGKASGKATEEIDKDNAKLLTQTNKANELNAIIKVGNEERLAKWDMDKIKMLFLTEWSLEMIEPQRWQADLDITDEGVMKGGRLKGQASQLAGAYKAVSVSNASKGNIRSFLEGEGVYNQADPKRDSRYDEKSGKYIRKPAEDADKISEELIWMINYKVVISEKIKSKD